jgi:hypothetical protein
MARIRFPIVTSRHLYGATRVSARPIAATQRPREGHRKPAGEGREGKEECGGTRFLKEAGFPRTPSGKNFYMVGGRSYNTVSTVTWVAQCVSERARSRLW